MGFSKEFTQQMQTLINNTASQAGGTSADSSTSDLTGTSALDSLMKDLPNSSRKKQLEEESKSEDEMSASEIVEQRRKEREETYTKEAENPMDWLMMKAAQISEGLSRMTGSEEAAVEVEKKGWTPETVMKTAGSMVGEALTGIIAAPFDIPSKAYEARTGKPVRESAGDKMADYTMSDEQRAAQGWNFAGEVVSTMPIAEWLGTAAHSIGGTAADVGRLAKNTITDVQDADKVLSKVQKDLDVGSFGKQMAQTVGMQGALGAEMGAAEAARGDQFTEQNGGTTPDDWMQGAIQGGAQGAIMGGALTGASYAANRLTRHMANQKKEQDQNSFENNPAYTDQDTGYRNEHSIDSNQLAKDYFQEQASQMQSRIQDTKAEQEKREMSDQKSSYVAYAGRGLGMDQARTSVVDAVEKVRQEQNRDEKDAYWTQWHAANLGIKADELRKQCLDDTQTWGNHGDFFKTNFENAHMKDGALDSTTLNSFVVTKEPAYNEGASAFVHAGYNTDKANRLEVNGRIAKPFNADFDGDTMQIDIKPENVNNAKSIVDVVFDDYTKKSNLDLTDDGMFDNAWKKGEHSSDVMNTQNHLINAYDQVRTLNDKNFFEYNRRTDPSKKYLSKELFAKDLADGINESKGKSSTYIATKINKIVDEFKQYLEATNKQNNNGQNLTKEQRSQINAQAKNFKCELYDDAFGYRSSLEIEKIAADNDAMFREIEQKYFANDAEVKQLNEEAVKAANRQDQKQTITSGRSQQDVTQAGIITNQIGHHNVEATLGTGVNTQFRLRTLIKYFFGHTLSAKEYNALVNTKTEFEVATKVFLSLQANDEHVKERYKNLFFDSVGQKFADALNVLYKDKGFEEAVTLDSDQKTETYLKTLIEVYNNEAKTYNDSLAKLKSKGEERLGLTIEDPIESIKPINIEKDLTKAFKDTRFRELMLGTDNTEFKIILDNNGKKTNVSLKSLLMAAEKENFSNTTESFLRTCDNDMLAKCMYAAQEGIRNRKEMFFDSINNYINSMFKDVAGLELHVYGNDIDTNISHILVARRIADSINDLTGNRFFEETDVQTFYHNYPEIFEAIKNKDAKAFENAFWNITLDKTIKRKYSDAFGDTGVFQTLKDELNKHEKADNAIIEQCISDLTKIFKRPDVLDSNGFSSRSNLFHKGIRDKWETFISDVVSNDANGNIKLIFDDEGNINIKGLEASIRFLEKVFRNEKNKNLTYKDRIDLILTKQDSRNFGDESLRYKETLMDAMCDPNETITDLSVSNNLQMAKKWYNPDNPILETNVKSKNLETVKELERFFTDNGLENEATFHITRLTTQARELEKQNFNIACVDAAERAANYFAEKGQTIVEYEDKYLIMLHEKNTTLQKERFLNRYAATHDEAFTINDLLDNVNILRTILIDEPHTEFRIQHENAEYSIKRDDIFKAYNIDLKGNEPTGSQWCKLFNEAPQLVDILRTEHLDTGKIGNDSSLSFKVDRETSLTERIQKNIEDIEQGNAPVNKALAVDSFIEGQLGSTPHLFIQTSCFNNREKRNDPRYSYKTETSLSNKMMLTYFKQAILDQHEKEINGGKTTRNRREEFLNRASKVSEKNMNESVQIIRNNIDRNSYSPMQLLTDLGTNFEDTITQNAYCYLVAKAAKLDKAETDLFLQEMGVPKSTDFKIKELTGDLENELYDSITQRFMYEQILHKLNSISDNKHASETLTLNYLFPDTLKEKIETRDITNKDTIQASLKNLYGGLVKVLPQQFDLELNTKGENFVKRVISTIDIADPKNVETKIEMLANYINSDSFMPKEKNKFINTEEIKQAMTTVIFSNDFVNASPKDKSTLMINYLNQFILQYQLNKLQSNITTRKINVRGKDLYKSFMYNKLDDLAKETYETLKANGMNDEEIMTHLDSSSNIDDIFSNSHKSLSNEEFDMLNKDFVFYDNENLSSAIMTASDISTSNITHGIKADGTSNSDFVAAAAFDIINKDPDYKFPYGIETEQITDARQFLNVFYNKVYMKALDKSFNVMGDNSVNKDGLVRTDILIDLRNDPTGVLKELFGDYTENGKKDVIKLSQPQADEVVTKLNQIIADPSNPINKKIQSSKGKLSFSTAKDFSNIPTEMSRIINFSAEARLLKLKKSFGIDSPMNAIQDKVGQKTSTKVVPISGNIDQATFIKTLSDSIDEQREEYHINLAQDINKYNVDGANVPFVTDTSSSSNKFLSFAPESFDIYTKLSINLKNNAGKFILTEHQIKTAQQNNNNEICIKLKKDADINDPNGKDIIILNDEFLNKVENIEVYNQNPVSMFRQMAKKGIEYVWLNQDSATDKGAKKASLDEWLYPTQPKIVKSSLDFIPQVLENAGYNASGLKPRVAYETRAVVDYGSIANNLRILDQETIQPKPIHAKINSIQRKSPNTSNYSGKSFGEIETEKVKSSYLDPATGEYVEQPIKLKTTVKVTNPSKSAYAIEKEMKKSSNYIFSIGDIFVGNRQPVSSKTNIEIDVKEFNNKGQAKMKNQGHDLYVCNHDGTEGNKAFENIINQTIDNSSEKIVFDQASYAAFEEYCSRNDIQISNVESFKFNNQNHYIVWMIGSKIPSLSVRNVHYDAAVDSYSRHMNNAARFYVIHDENGLPLGKGYETGESVFSLFKLGLDATKYCEHTNHALEIKGTEPELISLNMIDSGLVSSDDIKNNLYLDRAVDDFIKTQPAAFHNKQDKRNARNKTINDATLVDEAIDKYRQTVENMLNGLATTNFSHESNGNIIITEPKGNQILGFVKSTINGENKYEPIFFNGNSNGLDYIRIGLDNKKYNRLYLQGVVEEKALSEIQAGKNNVYSFVIGGELDNSGEADKFFASNYETKGTGTTFNDVSCQLGGGIMVHGGIGKDTLNSRMKGVPLTVTNPEAVTYYSICKLATTNNIRQGERKVNFSLMNKIRKAAEDNPSSGLAKWYEKYAKEFIAYTENGKDVFKTTYENKITEKQKLAIRELVDKNLIRFLDFSDKTHSNKIKDTEIHDALSRSLKNMEMRGINPFSILEDSFLHTPDNNRTDINRNFDESNPNILYAVMHWLTHEQGKEDVVTPKADKQLLLKLTDKNDLEEMIKNKESIPLIHEGHMLQKYSADSPTVKDVLVYGKVAFEYTGSNREISSRGNVNFGGKNGHPQAFKNTIQQGAKGSYINFLKNNAIVDRTVSNTKVIDTYKMQKANDKTINYQKYNSYGLDSNVQKKYSTASYYHGYEDGSLYEKARNQLKYQRERVDYIYEKDSENVIDIWKSDAMNLLENALQKVFDAKNISRKINTEDKWQMLQLMNNEIGRSFNVSNKEHSTSSPDKIPWNHNVFVDVLTDVQNKLISDDDLGFSKNNKENYKGYSKKDNFPSILSNVATINWLDSVGIRTKTDLIKYAHENMLEYLQYVKINVEDPAKRKAILDNAYFKMLELGEPPENLALLNEISYIQILENNLSNREHIYFDGGDLDAFIQASRLMTENLKTIQKTMIEHRKKVVKDDSVLYGAYAMKFKSEDKTLTNFLRNAKSLSQMMGLPSVGTFLQNATDKGINYGLQRASLSLGLRGVGRDCTLSDIPYDIEKALPAIKEKAKDAGMKKVLDNAHVLEFLGHGEDVRMFLETPGNTFDMFMKKIQTEEGVVNKLYRGTARIFTAADVAKSLRNENFILNWIKTAYQLGYGEMLFKKDMDGSCLFDRVLKESSGEQLAVLLLFGDAKRFPTEGRNTGRVAWNNTLRGDLAQENVAIWLIEHALKGNALFDFIFHTVGAKYLRASMNTLARGSQWFAPVSTFNYAAAKLMQSDKFINWAKRHGDKNLKMLLESKEGVKAFKNEMEVVKGFHTLRENLLTDMFHMTVPAFACALAGCVALQPPEEEQYRCNYEEWTICGLRIGANWWLKDIAGIALPLACFWKSCSEGKPDMTILFHGVGEHLNNNPFLKIGDVFTSLLEPDALFEEMEQTSAAYSKSEMGSPDSVQYIFGALPGFGMSYASQFVTPSFLKEMAGNFSNYASSYSTVWETGPTGALTEDAQKYGKTQKADYVDAMVRKITRNNPVLGMFCNIAPGFNHTTSYCGWDMPKQVIYDPTQVNFIKEYSILNQDGSEKSNEEKQKVAAQLVFMLTSASVDELKQAGWCLNTDTRNYVADLIHDLWTKTKDDFQAKKDSGALDYYLLGDGDYNKGKQVYSELYKEYQAQLEMYRSLYAEKLMNKDLNQGMQAYNRMNTTWLQDRNGNWYATGYQKGLGGLLNPFIYATDNNSNGAAGSYASLSEVNGQGMYDKNGNAMRGLYAVSSPSRNVTLEDWAKQYNNSYSNNYNQSSGYSSNYKRGSYGYSGGYRSGGGSSGGGSKSIYSHSPTLNIKAPAAVRSSNLKDSQFDYLRPNYETKGSRYARAYNNI